VALPSVQRALKDGMIAIAKGTTNAYIVEELLGKPIDKPAYTIGVTLPQKTMHTTGLREQKLPDVVLKNGVPVEGMTVIEAVRQMKRGRCLHQRGKCPRLQTESRWHPRWSPGRRDYWSHPRDCHCPAD
jgi:hypothetical protein